MSDIISQSVSVAPAKWYIKFEHVAYARPNVEEFLSPLLAASGDREIRARRVLRRLLDEQADINESLAEENDTLQRHLKGLLALLIAKDRQLESNLARKSIVRRMPLPRLALRRMQCRVQRCFARWRVNALMLALKGMSRDLAAGKLVGVLDSIQHIWKLGIWKNLQGPVKLHRLAAIAKRKTLTQGFRVIRDFATWKSAKSYTSGYRLYAVLEKAMSRTFSHAFNSFFRYQRNRKVTAVRIVIRLGLKQLAEVMGKWKYFALLCMNKRESATLRLVQLCKTMGSYYRVQLLRKMYIWSQGKARKNIEGKVVQGCEELKKAIRGYLHRRLWKLLSYKSQPLLGRLLIDIGKNTMRAAFQRVSIYSEAKKSADIISALTSSLREAQYQLQSTVSESTKAHSSLQSEIASLQASQSSERQTYSQQSSSYESSINTLTLELETMRKRSETERLAQLAEVERLASDVTFLQSSCSLLESQLAQANHERAKIAASENELQRHVTALNAAVESISEEKNSLEERSQAAEENLAIAQEQMESMRRASSQRRDSGLEARVSELETALAAQESKAAQRQKDAAGLQQLAQELRTQLEQSVEKAKRLSKENAQLSSRLEELQKEQSVAKTTNGQLSSQVLKLNKEIADLKIEMSEVKSICARLQSDNKAQRNELELMDTDLKRIQAERDRLILALREQQKTALAEVRTLQEQSRRLQEELGRTQNSAENEPSSNSGETQRLQKLLEAKETELEEFRQAAEQSNEKFSALLGEVENYATIFVVLDRRVEELESALQKVQRERDALLELSQLRTSN